MSDERPDYIPGWWGIRNGRYSAARWMLRSPQNALKYWLVTGVVGVLIVAWRVIGGDSLGDFFGTGRSIGLTVIAVLLIVMAALYGSRAYRATQAKWSKNPATPESPR